MRESCLHDLDKLENSETDIGHYVILKLESCVLRVMRESNSRRRFWRPKLYHLTNHPRCYRIVTRAAGQGLEPRSLGPKPSVLPLDDPAM